MNPLWLVAVSVGLPSIAWMVVRWRESTVYQRISERALEDCPAPHAQEFCGRWRKSRAN